VKGVILQHAPFRKYVDCVENRKCWLPDIETEIKLIEMYGSRVICIALNGSGGSLDELQAYAEHVQKNTNIPVVLPLVSLSWGMTKILPILDQFIKDHAALPDTTV
ncbi:MAG: DUF1611 domain-containing protein, partial [Desulfobacterales bacterium]|nr:DUF1611 domain-containing protein [Desulfobacterales bacterium]